MGGAGPVSRCAAGERARDLGIPMRQSAAAVRSPTDGAHGSRAGAYHIMLRTALMSMLFIMHHHHHICALDSHQQFLTGSTHVLERVGL